MSTLKKAFTILTCFILSYSVALAQNIPCAATLLPNNMMDFQNASTSGLSNSGIADPGCGGPLTQDAWFSVTAPPSGDVYIATLAGSMNNAAMAIYEGPCTAPELITCTEDDLCGNSIMPIYNFDDLTPGTTYFIRIWGQSGQSGTFEIRVSDGQPPQDPLVLNAAAGSPVILQSDGCYQMTSANQSFTPSCAYAPNLVNFSQPFTNTVNMNFGTQDANGADGITMIYQNDSPNACGPPGGDIAAGGINNSFIIEFDTWDNGAIVGDIVQDHVAININGDMANPIFPAVPLGNIEDGATYEVSFTWNPATMFFEVYFDGVLMISGNYDIVGNCFGGVTSVYCGFTSSTGGSTNTHLVCPVGPPNYQSGDLSIQEVEICQGDTYFAGGGNQSIAGTYQDIYPTWNGCDSIIETRLSVIPGSQSVLNEIICNGDCIMVGNQNYCTSGAYQVTGLTNWQNCDSTVNLNLTVLTLMPNIIKSGDLGCLTNQVTLNGSSSTPAGGSFDWSTLDGNIVGSTTGSSVSVNQPGTYTLTMTANIGANICSETTTIEVFDDNMAPVIEIDPIVDIDCTNPNTIIDASGSSSGTYSWTGPGIVSGDNTSMPTVNMAGDYTLTLTGVNGCPTTETVTVNAGQSSLNVVIEPSTIITCANPLALLDGSNSDNGVNYQYVWSTTDGTFSGATNEPTAMASAAGTYTLTVTNLDNNCMGSDMITISDNLTQPDISIANPNQLTCDSTIVTLQGNSTTPNVNITWTTVGGTIDSGTNSFAPVVSAVGDYTMTLIDPSNGCSITQAVSVSNNTTTPVADAGGIQTLDCSGTDVTLDGNNSSAGLSYAWTNSSNTNVGNNITAMVGIADLYTLLVTDSSNGCSATDTVSVFQSTDQPNISFVNPNAIDCQNGTVTIDASGSDNGAIYTISWMTTDGTIDSGANGLMPVVSEPGDYELTILNTTNNCSSIETVTVIGDAAVPQIMIDIAGDLTCSDTLININATTNLTAGNYSISWMTGDGNIVGTDTLLNINVNQIGTYTATIINTNNNCDADASITIGNDLAEPIAEAGDGVMIGCAQPSVDLDGTGSSTVDVNYTWLDPNNGTAATGTLMPSVGSSGTYILVVTNIGNGCSAQDTVSVMQDANLPTISVLPTGTISCANTAVTIDASNSDNGPNYTYNWTTVDGTITSVTDELTVDVSAGETYTFTLTNMDNNCTAMQDVIVPNDLTPPNVLIAMPNELSCDSTTVTLDGSPSGNAADFAINWTTTDGDIDSNANTFSPVVSTSAIYTMTLTSNANGCTDSLQIVVPENITPPNAEAGMNQEIGCDLAPLNLAGSSTTMNATYAWNTGNGNILMNADTPMPQVNQAGTYTLTITDPLNGCTNTDNVDVTPTADLPTVSIVQPLVELTCDTPSLNLDASGSDSGMNYTIAWTTANGGNITMGDNTLSPTVDEAGDYILTITNTQSGCSNMAMVTVNEEASSFALMLDTPPTLDCQTTSTILNVIPDGNGTFNFEWATGDGNITLNEMTASPSIDQGGTYSVTVTNTDNGCTADTMLTVTQDNIAPTAIIESASDIDCNNLTSILDASNSSQGAMFQYVWTTIDGGNITNEMTATPTVDDGGTYMLTITNTQNQCPATTQVTIVADTDVPVIDPSIPNDLSCLNTEEQLTITPSNGLNFSYQWSTINGNLTSPDTDQNPLANQAGDYEVLVTNTDNNCTETAMISLAGNFDLPIASINAATQITCELDNIDLTGIDANGAGNYAYEWTTTDGNIVGAIDALTANVNQGGTYIFNITNEDNGCEKDTMVTVLEDILLPNIDIETPGELTCIEMDVMLDASNSSTGAEFEYEWTSANTITDPTIANPTVAAAGNYVLTITNTDNGCEITEDVDVLEDIQTPNITLANTAIINCDTESIDLVASVNGTANNSFAWTTSNGDITAGSTSASATAGSTGTYTITATNEDNGCTDDATITVAENLPTASTQATQPICESDRGSIIVTDVLGGEAPYVYSNDGGVNFSSAFTFSNLEPGNYNIIVQDINGCEFEESVVITTGLAPEIDIEEVQMINLGETIQLNPQINFDLANVDSLIWTPSDSLSCDTCLTPTSNTLNEIAYTLYIEVEGGCTVEQTVIIMVDRTQKIYVPNAFSPNDDNVNDNFTIFADKDNVAQIEVLEIFTRWGEMVFRNTEFQPNDESEGWNGVHQNKLMNPAVFIWRAEVTLRDGRTELLQGDLVLMR